MSRHFFERASHPQPTEPCAWCSICAGDVTSNADGVLGYRPGLKPTAESSADRPYVWLCACCVEGICRALLDAPRPSPSNFDTTMPGPEGLRVYTASNDGDVVIRRSIGSIMAPTFVRLDGPTGETEWVAAQLAAIVGAPSEKPVPDAPGWWAHEHPAWPGSDSEETATTWYRAFRDNEGLRLTVPGQRGLGLVPVIPKGGRWYGSFALPWETGAFARAVP